MALETATYINGLVVSNPAATDGLAESDNHHRLVKSTLKNTFPNITGAITATHQELNVLDGITATVGELNALDGIIVGSTQLNTLYNASGNIQTQINTLTANLNSVDTDLVNDTTPQLGGDLDTNGNAISFGSWTIEIDGSNNLLFKYAGDTKIRLTSAGALDVEDDITAFSGI